jgi:UDPglucose 6-dehydrogenase
MQVAVLGTGYVGLVCGACFAKLGCKVTCIDSDSRKIAQLKAGRMPIFEPGLDALVSEHARAGRLTFTTDLRSAIPHADVVFITVGTPPGPEGRADLSFVYQCAAAIARHLQDYTVVATKSTVPLGTGEEIEAIIRRQRPAGSFAVVSNPEFLREGAAIADFMEPDRIVIGIEDERARATMMRLYHAFSERDVPVLFTNRRTAELIKYASNAFLATKIAFMGEIADLCEKSGADVEHVSLGMGLDQRIGAKFLQAGPGYGGSCFPKDALALVATARQFGTRPRIVPTVIEANEARKSSMADRIVEACGGSVRNKRVALLGLTFKAGTDDVRAAPSLAIVPRLEAMGARVCAYDPAGMKQARKLLPRLRTARDPHACAREADAVVILTEWDEFKRLDLARLKAEVHTPVLIDLRNVFRPETVLRHGFAYAGIGRSRRTAAGQPRGEERAVAERVHAATPTPKSSSLKQ